MKIPIPSRMKFLASLAASLLGLYLAGAQAGEKDAAGGVYWPEFEQGYASAFENYRPGKDPSVELTGPEEILHSRYGEWKFVFTAGSEGLGEGAGVAVATRHVAGWGATQDFDPAGANYVTASSSGDVQLKLNALNDFSIANEYFHEYFAFQHLTTVEVVEGELAPSETLTLVFGDRSQSSPGFRAPPIARPQAQFLAMARHGSSEQFQPIPARLAVRILPGPSEQFSVVIPSNAAAGEPFRAIIRAEDDQGNVAAGYQGKAELTAVGCEADLPETVAFGEAQQGLYEVRDARFSGTGVCRVRVRDAEEEIAGESNPVLVSETLPERRLLWGDFHAHSVFSDGTGSPAQAYTYARDVAALDFFALSDHAYQLNQDRWDIIRETVTRFHDPPRFSAFYGNEWSGITGVGGDHNVIYARGDLPLYRSNSYYEPKNPFIYSGPDLDAPHIVQLYKRFRRVAKEKNARILAFPSIRGRIANPRWNDERFSPVVETVSEAGWYESLALEFLRRGHRVGFIGSSDDHHGRHGYGTADKPEVGYSDESATAQDTRRRFGHPWGKNVAGSPMMGVYAEENSREAIFDAIFARRTYATTGDRIVLWFEAGGHPMGSEYEPDAPPQFEIKVQGTAPIRAVHLKKDGEVLKTFRPQDGSRRFSASYRESGDYRGHFYYAVVDQANGQRAIASPIWAD